MEMENSNRENAYGNGNKNETKEAKLVKTNWNARKGKETKKQGQQKKRKDET